MTWQEKVNVGDAVAFCPGMVCVAWVKSVGDDHLEVEFSDNRRRMLVPFHSVLWVQKPVIPADAIPPAGK